MVIRYLVCLLYFGFSCQLNGADIRLVTTDWPPFFGKDLHKNGITSEIARQALERVGHTLTIDFVPWKRALRVAEAGKYHGVFACWANEERSKIYNISKEAIHDGGSHFVTPQDSDKKVTKVEDLNGVSVGIIRGYAYSKKLQRQLETKKTKMIEARDVKQLFALLEKGRVDFIMDNPMVLRAEYKKLNPGKKFHFKSVGTDFIDGGLYICWSRKGENTDQMAADFEKGIKQIRTDGTFERIVEEFGFGE